MEVHMMCVLFFVGGVYLGYKKPELVANIVSQSKKFWNDITDKFKKKD